ncbi:NADH-quinone oxidoreductase subunit J [Desulfoprunum benzoelyticum]|uniref:NADH-quinone oxidoreductase subunit J n=1 Tax=Desulfoprunum benzoelyticum TaxID=1506996 RepID=A0A840UTJ2_9BACT|nr:NADH-quinone oxidoreductase subunit J [Desulfoprunum benzoelyticum]MBB5349507.1 NADH-quinone oxidoreductase subunit J [Desulfoprunum benzoelyticum]MBM9531570.1 NADH-quinone oxidoreductase subunit J [Desulfoprunum benzoelyticum]
MMKTLFSADGLVGLLFLFNLIVTVVGGIVACNAERLVRAVIGLVVCFVGVAGIYFFLNSPFIAMMHILIYIGAVAVAISFAIMLAAPEEKMRTGPTSPLSGPIGLISTLLLISGLVSLALKTEWTSVTKINDGSVKTIGIQLLTNHSMVFELISIVLLLAILGALVIARGGREE